MISTGFNPSAISKECFDCQTGKSSPNTTWADKEPCGDFDEKTKKCSPDKGRDCYSFTIRTNGLNVSLHDCDGLDKYYSEDCKSLTSVIFTYKSPYFEQIFSYDFWFMIKIGAKIYLKIFYTFLSREIQK